MLFLTQNCLKTSIFGTLGHFSQRVLTICALYDQINFEGCKYLCQVPFSQISRQEIQNSSCGSKKHFLSLQVDAITTFTQHFQDKHKRLGYTHHMSAKKCRHYMKLKYDTKYSTYLENWWDIGYKTHQLEISIRKEISNKKKAHFGEVLYIAGQYTKSFKRVEFKGYIKLFQGSLFWRAN